MEQAEIERIRIWEEASEVKVQESIETHISWVLLTMDHAYKIKKPLKTTFLDYSTLSKRKYYCQKEIVLNKRLAEEIYLRAVPIKLHRGIINMGGTDGETIDYAVMMNKMNHCKQMDLLLEAGKVTSFSITQVAQKVARFHEKAQKISLSLEQETLKKNFNDMLSISACVQEFLASDYIHNMEKACGLSDAFLEKNRVLMQKRVSEGCYRDCHGDLHAKNIILEENEPIIFDCIEFNDAFRHIDVLNEIAFFCMELEVMEKETLSNFFVKEYLAHTTIAYDHTLEDLLCYYKMYRANIRAKVVAMTLMDKEKNTEVDTLILKLQKYLDRMVAYSEALAQAHLY